MIRRLLRSLSTVLFVAGVVRLIRRGRDSEPAGDAAIRADDAQAALPLAALTADDGARPEPALREPEPEPAQPHRRPMIRRLLRSLSTVLIVSGVLLISDAVTAVVWQEPVS